MSASRFVSDGAQQRAAPDLGSRCSLRLVSARVHRDVAPEFVHGLPQFLDMLSGRLHVVEIYRQIIQYLQGSEHIAMPQGPLDAFQLLRLVETKAS
jgi:hypothetical protein